MIIRHINIPQHMVADNIRYCKVQLKQHAEEVQSYDITISFSNGAITEYTGHHAEDILQANNKIKEYVEDIIRHQVKREFNLVRTPTDYQAAEHE